MKIYENIEQGTDKWHELRIGKFGSTDAQAVGSNGKGLTTKCYEKAVEIVTQTKMGTKYSNKHLERGIELEPMARMAYEIETGSEVKQVGYIELDEHTGGSPDGLVGDDGLIEIKCPTSVNFLKEMLGDKKMSSAYGWQMQHLMYLTDRKWCDYVIFNADLDRIKITRIARDEDMIEDIKKGLEAGKKQIKQIIEKIK
jgi:putative phage-type endonuclease